MIFFIFPTSHKICFTFQNLFAIINTEHKRLGGLKASWKWSFSKDGVVFSHFIWLEDSEIRSLKLANKLYYPISNSFELPVAPLCGDFFFYAKTA